MKTKLIGENPHTADKIIRQERCPRTNGRRKDGEKGRGKGCKTEHDPHSHQSTQ